MLDGAMTMQGKTVRLGEGKIQEHDRIKEEWKESERIFFFLSLSVSEQCRTSFVLFVERKDLRVFLLLLSIVRTSSFFFVM